MSQDLENNRSSNSSNEQTRPKKFSLENLANLSKILASVVSIVFHCWKMIFISKRVTPEFGENSTIRNFVE